MSNDPHCRLSHLTPKADVSTCAQCDELLDAYLDAAFAQQEVRARYPALWRHLQTCVRCAHHYHTLSAILSSAEPTPPPSLDLAPPELPFLALTQSSTPDQVQVPWQVHLGSALLGEPLHLRFTFAVAYLQQCLTDTTQRNLTTLPGADENPPPVRYLLQEEIRFGQQSVLVNVRALFLPGQQDNVHIQATLTSSHPLPDEILATLHWGGHSSTCRVSDTGAADLGVVPLDALQASQACASPVFAIHFGVAAKQ